MATIVEKVKEFNQGLDEQYPKSSLQSSIYLYLAIGEDGNIKISPFMDYLSNAQTGIVIRKVDYTVWNFSHTFGQHGKTHVVYFVDNESACDFHYFHSGWIIDVE